MASVPQPISQFERLLSTTASGCSLKGSGREDDPLRQSIFGLLAFQNGLRNILAQLKAVASTNVTVLIAGETGTGKELIAQAIHEMSSRREHKIVNLNCAAIPVGLLESELFGHERGAFTGAVNS